ncbi:hypothetical protein CEXT_775451 [Caerostris extrusa]|uniref:Uncharacterized protein n=1 Tax=Caerostris extrusa TaxID=172846 RepID=A0AAV4QT06_CAEEX|nr:hypothetical protein CEXT_775451 [Caerostris extrusa]
MRNENDYLNFTNGNLLPSAANIRARSVWLTCIGSSLGLPFAFIKRIILCKNAEGKEAIPSSVGTAEMSAGVSKTINLGNLTVCGANSDRCCWLFIRFECVPQLFVFGE